MEIKPCPYCGRKPKEYSDGGGFHVAYCNNPNCQNSGEADLSIAAWNTRPIEDAQAARIAELEAQRPYIMAPGEMGGAMIKLNEHLRLADARITELEGQLKMAANATPLQWTGITKDPSTWPPRDGAWVLTALPMGRAHWVFVATYGYSADTVAMERFGENGQQWVVFNAPRKP